MRTYFCKYDCAVGTLLLKSDGEFLTGVWMLGEKHAPILQTDWIEDKSVFTEALQQVQEYFVGERKEFNLKLRFERGTDFQKQVWNELCAIGYGETISYSELARRVGRPLGMRAVGLANGQNPFSIVIPCHRVIGANGTLTGYAGGLERKQWLLNFERKHAQTAPLILQMETALAV